MDQRALTEDEKAWGLGHKSTLSTMNNLGALYSSQGKLKEAEEMYQRALKGMEKAGGAEHKSAWPSFFIRIVQIQSFSAFPLFLFTASRSSLFCWIQRSLVRLKG